MIEMLVVIAVVAVLTAAILLPAIGKVREMAAVSQSSANLRAIGVATQLYIGEHGGRLPNRSNSEWSAPFWTDQVAPYLPKSEVGESYRGTRLVVHPVMLDPLLPDDRHHTIADYGINHAVFIPTPTPERLANGAAASGMIFDIPNPAKLVAFATAENSQFDPPIGSFFIETRQYIYDPTYRVHPSSRDIGAILCGFADGHVEKIDADEFLERREELLLP
jgi:general secretion pathway protein G